MKITKSLWNVNQKAFQASLLLHGNKRDESRLHTLTLGCIYNPDAVAKHFDTVEFHSKQMTKVCPKLGFPNLNFVFTSNLLHFYLLHHVPERIYVISPQINNSKWAELSTSQLKGRTSKSSTKSVAEVCILFVPLPSFLVLREF